MIRMLTSLLHTALALLLGTNQSLFKSEPRLVIYFSPNKLWFALGLLLVACLEEAMGPGSGIIVSQTLACFPVAQQMWEMNKASLLLTCIKP